MVFAGLTLLAIGAMFRPLLFASVDPEIAAAAQHLAARPSHALAYAVAIAVLCVWLGLFIGLSFTRTRRCPPVSSSLRWPF